MNIFKRLFFKKMLNDKLLRDFETEKLIDEDLREQIKFNKKTRALLDKKIRMKTIQDDQRQMMIDAGLLEEEEEEEEENNDFESQITRTLLNKILGNNQNTPINEFSIGNEGVSAKTELSNKLNGLTEEEAEKLKRGLGL